MLKSFFLQAPGQPHVRSKWHFLPGVTFNPVCPVDLVERALVIVPNSGMDNLACIQQFLKPMLVDWFSL